MNGQIKMVTGKHPLITVDDTWAVSTDNTPCSGTTVFIVFQSQEAADLLDEFMPKFNSAIDIGSIRDVNLLHHQLKEQVKSKDLPPEDLDKLTGEFLADQLLCNVMKSSFKHAILDKISTGIPLDVNALAIKFRQNENSEFLKKARVIADLHNNKFKEIAELIDTALGDNFSKDPFARIKARIALEQAKREQEKALQQPQQPDTPSSGFGKYQAPRRPNAFQDILPPPDANTGGNGKTTIPTENSIPSISKWKIAAGYYLCYSYSAACYALGAVRTDINYIEKGGISIPDLDTTKPVWRDENEHVLRVPNRLLVRLMSGYLINDFNSDIWKKPPPLGSDFNSNLWRVPSPLGWVFLTGFGTMVIGINTASPKVERAGIAIANTAATPLKGIYRTLFDFAGYGKKLQKGSDESSTEESEKYFFQPKRLKGSFQSSSIVPQSSALPGIEDYNVTSITLNDTALNAEQINNLTKYTLDMEEQTPTSTLSPS